MERAKRGRALAVWMNGELVGHWRLPSRGGDEFQYADSWLESPASRPISLSLPLRPSRAPYRTGVAAYFENLLPDNPQIRERLQRRFHAASTAAFDLLAEIGRDCVGALQLLDPQEPAPHVRQITGVPLKPADIEGLLSGTLAPSLGQPEEADTFRISLAGAQEKTALLRHRGQWHRPTGATPTTHILKLPMGVSPQGIDLSTSVENEWLCAQIVHAYGIAVAPCAIETFGRYKTLVVERFDRRKSADESWWMRLPQEDFCQVTGTPPAFKYENDGGPGMRTIMDVLLASERARDDREDFIRTQILFWLLAAIDGHAKNFSIFLLPGGAFHLTPRYDILSAYPMLGHGRGLLSPEKIKMAMSVQGKNRHYHWNGIRLRHWLETGGRNGIPDLRRIIDGLIDQTPEVLARVQDRLPIGFPADIAGRILEGVRHASARLKEERAA